MPQQITGRLAVLLSDGRRRKEKGRCMINYCKQRARSKGVCCSRHHMQLKKVLDPISYIFDIRVQDAKRRGKDWTITRENFKQWCTYTGYHLLTGRTTTSASLDRKDSRYGYHIWNLASIPLGVNSSKGNRDLGRYEQGPDGSQTWVPLDSLPF